MCVVSLIAAFKAVIVVLICPLLLAGFACLFCANPSCVNAILAESGALIVAQFLA